jgi:hypothetical protein
MSSGSGGSEPLGAGMRSETQVAVVGAAWTGGCRVSSAATVFRGCRVDGALF